MRSRSRHAHAEQFRSRRRRLRPALLPLALGGAVLLAVAGCIPVQPLESPGDRTNIVESVLPEDPDRIVEGGTLTMGLSSEPDALDPTTSGSLYTRYVMQTICQKLYDIDGEGEIVPQLATALPTWSADGKSATIPLREGVVFADGEPFDAEAVLTTLDRHLNHPESGRAGELGPITGMEAVDDHTVRVDFEETFAPFTASLADRAGMILSPKAIAELGDDFFTNPTCVGPFKFVQRIPQTSITVERDPLYYDAENIHLDRIVYRIMSDGNTRAANLRSGDIQVADTLSSNDFDALKQEDGIETLQVGSFGYQALYVNMGNRNGEIEPFDTPLATEPRIREALSMAIDRETLVNSLTNGWNEAACTPVPPASYFATPENTKCPEYDPEAARALMEETGVELPFEIDMKVSNTAGSIRYAEALQASVEPAGFRINLVPTEYTTMLADQEVGNYEVAQFGWSGRVDPHNNVYNYVHQDSATNRVGLADQELSDLLDSAAAVTDVPTRADRYADVVERMQEINPIIYLYRTRSLTAHTSDVSGIQVYADGVVHLSHAAFVEEEE
ncbi:ABC transporter substrate-binding protein [Brevibacterium samyangense]|uniref:ABC transporter substrate-binding protein n=1 Tax=Brevibacterium samyangense TaxID=366888 RepID=A0ABN2T315_9MICO